MGNEFLGKSGVAFESEVGPEMLEGSGVVVVADGAAVDEDVDGGRDRFLSDGFFDERSESAKTQFTPGDDAYTLAKQYAETKKATFPLKLLLYTGDGKKDFNWEGNVAYSTYLDFLKIPHRHLLISDCGHSTTQAYKISGKDLFSFLSPILQKASEGTN